MKRKILLFALISEGALAVIAVTWYYLSDAHSAALKLSTEAITLGIAAFFTLILLNGALYVVAARYRDGANQLKLFSETVVEPLCRSLDLRTAAAVSLAAGLAEELFFRGFLTDFLSQYFSLQGAILIANLLFAYVHLIGSVRKFFAVFILYFLFGLFFSLLTVFSSGNLLPAMLSHALYDFVVIAYFLKRK